MAKPKRLCDLTALMFGFVLVLIAARTGGYLHAGENTIALSFSGDGDYLDLGVDAGDLGIDGNREKTIELRVFIRNFQSDKGLFSLGTTGDSLRDFSLRVLGGTQRIYADGELIGEQDGELDTSTEQNLKKLGTISGRSLHEAFWGGLREHDDDLPGFWDGEARRRRAEMGPKGAGLVRRVGQAGPERAPL